MHVNLCQSCKMIYLLVTCVLVSLQISFKFKLLICSFFTRYSNLYLSSQLRLSAACYRQETESKPVGGY